MSLLQRWFFWLTSKPLSLSSCAIPFVWGEFIHEIFARFASSSSHLSVLAHWLRRRDGNSNGNGDSDVNVVECRLSFDTSDEGVFRAAFEKRYMQSTQSSLALFVCVCVCVGPRVFGACNANAMKHAASKRADASTRSLSLSALPLSPCECGNVWELFVVTKCSPCTVGGRAA